VLGANNGLGIVGVAPGAKLKEARVLKTQADGSVSGLNASPVTVHSVALSGLAALWPMRTTVPSGEPST
jgi:hypothetical protein